MWVLHFTSCCHGNRLVGIMKKSPNQNNISFFSIETLSKLYYTFYLNMEDKTCQYCSAKDDDNFWVLYFYPGQGPGILQNNILVYLLPE